MEELAPDDATRVADLIRSGLADAGYTNQVEGVLWAARSSMPKSRIRWFLLASRVKDVQLRLPEPCGPH